VFFNNMVKSFTSLYLCLSVSSPIYF
jgi:hypothetical protein